MSEIVILNGGPRKNGATASVLALFEAAFPKTARIRRFDLYRMSVAPCVGCLACRPDGTCILPDDDGHEIAEAIGGADTLIVATPTYWGNMSGSLKTLFDRCVPVFEYIDGMTIRKMQRGKDAVIVTASSAPFPINRLPSRSAGTIRATRVVLRSGGYRIRGTVNVSGTGNGGVNPSDRESVQRRVRRIVARLVRDGSAR